jgi:hypothetical protein
LREINYGFLKTARRWKRLANEFGLQFELSPRPSLNLNEKQWTFIGLEHGIDDVSIDWEYPELKIIEPSANGTITIEADLGDYDREELDLRIIMPYKSKKAISFKIVPNKRSCRQGNNIDF